MVKKEQAQMAHTSTISLSTNECPLSTTMTIICTLVRDFSSNTSATPLRQEELNATKERNHVEALKMLMISQGI